MLVLTRKINEVIYIADRMIKIMVVDIKGEQVRIGIEAPRDISINRGEVQEDIELHGSIKM